MKYCTLLILALTSLCGFADTGSQCPQNIEISSFYKALEQAPLIRAATISAPEDKRAVTYGGLRFLMPDGQHSNLVQAGAEKMAKTGIVGIDFVKAEDLDNRVQCHYIVQLYSFYMPSIKIPNLNIRLTYVKPSGQ